MPEANPFLQLHDDLLYRIDERPHVALDRVAPGDPPAESSEGWVLTVDRQRIELPKPPPLPEPPVWEPLTLEPGWTGQVWLMIHNGTARLHGNAKSSASLPGRVLILPAKALPWVPGSVNSLTRYDTSIVNGSGDAYGAVIYAQGGALVASPPAGSGFSGQSLRLSSIPPWPVQPTATTP